MSEITTEMINDTLFGKNEDNGDNNQNRVEQEHISDESSGTDDSSDVDVNNVTPLSDDERRRNASLRRERERAQYEASVQQRIDNAYATAFKGQENPYTGKPILSEQDFNEYQKAMSQKAIEDAGIPTSALDKYISEHPTIKMANQIAEQAEAQRREAETKSGRIEMEKQIKLISSIDPDIKGVEDLINSPNAERFNELLSHGNSMFDAYRLANMDKIFKLESSRVKQETLNNINGKSHMAPINSAHAPTGDIDVPLDVMDMYRSLMPDMSSEEIYKDYNKRRKK